MPYPSPTLIYPSLFTYPGIVLPPVTWDKMDERYYRTGVDRGVLYPETKPAVPFNGITGVEEMGGGSSSVLYRDGKVFLADSDAGDYEGNLTAFMYPDEFSECVGIVQATDGLFVDNQKPQRFGLSYRSLIGSGLEGDMFGYEIHLIYKAMATLGTRSRKTLSETPEPMDFTFGLTATPVKLPGFRPSAHYIIDTRFLDAAVVQQLEDILYGTGGYPAAMPTPLQLFDLLKFGTSITFTEFEHASLGTCWRAEGSSSNLEILTPTTWAIHNVNGTDHGDGTYTLEDTP